MPAINLFQGSFELFVPSHHGVIHAKSHCLCRLILLITVTLAPTTAIAQRHTGPRHPTPVESLNEQGFESTNEGLNAAMDSTDRVAQSYAMRAARSLSNPAILDKASHLLTSIQIDSIQFISTWVGLEAAKYLASFNREEGWNMLREYASTKLDGKKKYYPGVLESITYLAELGDESYIDQVQWMLEHKSTTGLAGAQALRNFRSINNPAVERAWLTAVQIVKDRILHGKDNTQHTVIDNGQEQTYTLSETRMWWVGPLAGAAAKQTIVTPALLAAFADLAKLDHPASKRMREDMLKHWQSCELRQISLQKLNK